MQNLKVGDRVRRVQQGSPKWKGEVVESAEEWVRVRWDLYLGVYEYSRDEGNVEKWSGDYV